MVVTRFNQLIQEYHRLGNGDVFVGQVPASYLKSAMLTDLTERGIVLLPSATSQILSASKVAQAFMLNPWMVPHTLAIARRKQLLDAVTAYNRLGIGAAVTKTDGLHCGHGVRKWESLETLYSCLAFDENAFPFVLQPFVNDFTDIRVVVVDAFWEAYSRHNPHNFRMNLAGGGRSRPYELTAEQLALCHAVISRARMPYAHIDLMVSADGATYLSEIRLNGGIHGAGTSRHDLERLKQKRLNALAAGVQGVA
jgi:glutathione synthase/RimK-type ligase-like ATP-grasp enzyme